MIFFELIFELLYIKIKIKKKIKLSTFCKIRLNVIKKKIHKYWFAKFVVFHELYITRNYCHDFLDILHNVIKKYFEQNLLLKYKFFLISHSSFPND